MYNQHLKMSPSTIGGNGIFTSVKIPASTPIIEITGTLYTNSNLPDNPAVLQVGPNLFVGPSGGYDDYINHSCDPNCMLHIVGNRAIVYSIHVIPAGTELTFDYSTSSTDSLNDWQMICNCKSVLCRKTISGIQYLKPELIELYHKKNMIPLFLKETIFK